MNMNQKLVYKLKDGVISETVDQDMILFCPDTNCIVNLNRTASKICALLQSKITFDFLVNSFYNQFQEEKRPHKDVVENDVRSILDRLDEIGMLSTYEA